MEVLKSSNGDYQFYTSKEELPPEFQDYVVFDPGTGFSFFKHPLLSCIMPLVTPGPIREFFAEKTKWVNDALYVHNNPHRYLHRHERAFRSTLLLDMVSDGYWDDAKTNIRRACEFWKCAAYVWIDCEEDESSRIWEAILEVDIPHREFMTDAADRRALREQGDHITVYRGVQGTDSDEAFENGVLGFQWTLDEKVATFFSQRFLRGSNVGYILSTEVRTSDVIAYLTGRGESEIIVSPEALSWDGISIKEVTDARARTLKSERMQAFEQGFNQGLNVSF